MREWKKIGQLLVEDGVISLKTAARVLAMSREHSKRFGTILEKLKLATEEEIAMALARQYDVQMVPHITRYSYPPEVLQLVPCEVAIQNLIFPLQLKGNNLFVAIADPTDMKVLANLSANCNLTIIPRVTTKSEIYGAIRKHYLGKEVQKPVKSTVLIVDDDLTTLTIAREFLGRANFSVLVAHDGMEGFKVAMTSKPHLILTDKVMPKLNGFTLLESINAIPEIQSLPVILMSAKLSPSEEQMVFDMGFFDYIPKPLNAITLVSRVKRAFRFSEQKYNFF